ncbi:type II toxin-antitoxin system HicB family antitoxin [Pseudomonas sp. COW5]|uniref:type II toxin-antitoxin system HicB family antitoxin n=1 Tax=Pseudomonas sp. COW5 TaxID=2981253 RepID=UPI0022471503|nr:type II toxin-antitoxin system HicB family antitoxin [Pseudomonas sp. COW5]MCX2542062.1 type II toxin-antitoxin system HicB family antitoxin [Pseudomonas sp. COW5]
MLYPIAISPSEGDTTWGVEVPDFPGCFSAGNDQDHALEMAKEGIQTHIEILAESGAVIPAASKVSNHVSDPRFENCVWALVDVDISQCLGSTQKINITLPGYLLSRIDLHVSQHPEEKSRSAFLASAALRMLARTRWI